MPYCPIFLPVTMSHPSSSLSRNRGISSGRCCRSASKRTRYRLSVGFGTRDQRLGLALVDPVAQHPQAVPSPALGLRQRGRAIARPVVDEDDFSGEAVLVEGGAQLGNQLPDVGRLVVGGDESGQSRGMPASASHTRFLIRAGRMPSWSRYLATVRRAILIPSLLRRFTMAWSVRGRSGSLRPPGS